MGRALFAAAALLFASSCGELDDSKLSFDDAAGHWSRTDDYPGVGEGRLIVTNSGDDSVSLFDFAALDGPTWSELKRIPVGLSPAELEGPHHAAVAGRDFFYVGISNFVAGAGSGPHGAHGTGSTPGHLLKIRAADNVQVASARVDRNPGDLVASPDGKRIFQSHFDLLRITEVSRQLGPESEMDSKLAVIDTETMTRRSLTPLCPAAHGLELSADGTRLYASCYSDEVAVVDTRDPAMPVTRVKVAANAGGPLAPRHEPYAVTLHPSGNPLYVSALRSRRLLLLDTATDTMRDADAISLSGAPYFGDFSADGKTLYLPLQGPDLLAVIDTQTHLVTREEPLGPHGCQRVHQAFTVQPDRALLVVCEGNGTDPGTLLVLNLPDLSLRKKSAVGVFPDYVGLVR